MPNEKDTENLPDADAPDFLSRVWRWLFKRRTVQIALTYLAAGFAFLEFLDIGLRGSDSAGLIMDLARLFYLLGFLVIVFAAPLIFTGTHYFRTGLVAGIVAISLVAGIMIRAQFESLEPAGPLRSTGPVNETQTTQSSGNIPNSASSTSQTTGEFTSETPVDQVDGAAGSDPEASETVSENQNTLPARQETESQPDSAEPQQIVMEIDNEDTRTSDEQTGTEETMNPEPSRFERLVALYGSSDRIVLDTLARGRSLLNSTDAAIALRFYSVSGGRRYLNVEPSGSRRGTRLELFSVGATASMPVTVQSQCGQLEYLVEAVRISDNEAQITATLDRERSQENVRRAETLGQCLLN